MLLPILLPHLQRLLEHGSLWEREAAILALGAVAWGCGQGMSGHLPGLFPYLLNQLRETCPQLRSIVCWTLSRYASWVVEQNDHQKYLVPLIKGLLDAILDHNKKVQQAACSALSSVEEEAGEQLVPYLREILQYFGVALSRYQTSNLTILYDTLGTLADSVKSNLRSPEYIQLIMPPLFTQWQQLADQERLLLFLLELFTSLSQALGPAFQEYAPVCYARCLHLISGTINAAAAGHDPDMDFAVCALDLLSGMVEGLQQNFEHLITTPDFIKLLYECTQLPSQEVRVSAFALVGDLAKLCPGQLMPVLNVFVPALADNLNPAYLSLCNNASWAIGEITIKCGPSLIQPYTKGIMDKLLPILAEGDMNKALLENVAITIGR